MDTINDGGPAFPVKDAASWQAHGMTQRALMATILMHSELTTCGVPGEACEALVRAAADSGREVEDQMAHNAVQCADALLRALAEPKDPPAPMYRELYADEKARLDAADRLAAIVQQITKRPDFPALPDDLRERLDDAVEDINEPPIPF